MELKTETNSNNKINDIGVRVSLNETFSEKKKQTNKIIVIFFFYSNCV